MVFRPQCNDSDQLRLRCSPSRRACKNKSNAWPRSSHFRSSYTRDRLLDYGKDSVVVYIGYESARRVFHRVGFVGLSCKPEERPEDVEDALELGFIRTNRGQWVGS